MSYSIHGMKATLLSWGAQLGHKGVITDEMRRLQGHHKPSQASVSLYSRDDVGGQLEFHARLVAQIKQGWRPITPAIQERYATICLESYSFLLQCDAARFN